MYLSLEDLEIVYDGLDYLYGIEKDPHKKKKIDLLAKRVQTNIDDMYCPKDAMGNELPDVDT